MYGQSAPTGDWDAPTGGLVADGLGVGLALAALGLGLALAALGVVPGQGMQLAATCPGPCTDILWRGQ